MFAVKVLGKIIAIPMILVMTVLFYIVTIFSRIYGLAATVFNLVIMLCAIIALVLQQWNNLGIAVAILVISYLLMGGYSCAAEPPVQYRLSHLSRRSEPLIKHTICMMRVYSRNALSNPYTSRMEISCSASMLVMLIR